MIRTKKRKKFLYFGLFFFILFFVFFSFGEAKASTLSLSPSGGEFQAGSTFDVSILLDTEGKAINAVAVSLAFPADKLQVVSPSAGQSIIELWTAPPKYDNQAGRIELQGGIPGGINVSRGLVMRITFRVKSVGSASIRFLDTSKVLLHDGRGTESLKNTVNAVYSLVLPPPAGPIVSSDTHPDSSVWYNNPNVVLRWTNELEVDGYSYVLNDEPTTVPDDISEGLRSSVIYQGLEDRVHYFHIKASKNGQWGGITHFLIQTDSSPPADFPVKILPSNRTSRRQPAIQFETTDTSSGISHYELKIIPLRGKTDGQPFFFEVQSPYVPEEMAFGTYDIIVRVYDKANNHKEITQRLSIVSNVFEIISAEGIRIKSIFLLPWGLFWLISLIILIAFVYISWRVWKWHRSIEISKMEKQLPRHISEKLEELQGYQKKYGSRNLPILLLIFVSSLFALFGHGVLAEHFQVSPPIVTEISRNISNQEIFYIGGKTEAPQTEIILYLQSVQTGETLSHTFSSDRKGDWFYRHDTLLSSGNYLLWVQSKIAEEMSPPSSQIQITVYPIAIQFGASRISFTALYLILIILLLVALAGLIAFIAFHGYHSRKKHSALIKEIKEAEDSVRRGFAIIRRDIQAELKLFQKAKPTKELSDEEKEIASQLLSDLERVERYIGKEVWDIERVEEKD